MLIYPIVTKQNKLKGKEWENDGQGGVKRQGERDVTGGKVFLGQVVSGLIVSPLSAHKYSLGSTCGVEDEERRGPGCCGSLYLI